MHDNLLSDYWGGNDKIFITSSTVELPLIIIGVYGDPLAGFEIIKGGIGAGVNLVGDDGSIDVRDTTGDVNLIRHNDFLTHLVRVVQDWVLVAIRAVNVFTDINVTVDNKGANLVDIGEVALVRVL